MASPQDLRLARSLLEQGLVDEKKLTVCLQEQKRSRAPQPLMAMLLRKGWLPPGAINQLSRSSPPRKGLDLEARMPAEAPLDRFGCDRAPQASGRETGRRSPTIFIETPPSEGYPPVKGGRFGRYVILEEVARGGMGIVYRAYQPNLRRVVALKLLREGMSGEDSVRRFRREVQAMARLSHPHIVPLYEAGKRGGQFYYTMQYVDGGTFRTLLDAFWGGASGRGKRCGQTPGGRCWRSLTASRSVELSAGRGSSPRESPATVEVRLQLRELIGLLRDAARAVAFAHENGLVHRDLKPENVLVHPLTSASECGTRSRVRSRVRDSRFPSSASGPALVAKVADFGLVRSMETRSRLTHTGHTLGTPYYMSPEQARGLGRQVGPPADVFSLGAILHELVTGALPFTGENPGDVIRKVLDEEPRPARRLNRAVSRDLETIILKALEKKPENRYREAGELADELDRYLCGDPIAARPVGAPVRLWRRARRYRIPIAATAAALLLLALGWLWLAGEKSEFEAARSSFDEAAPLITRGDVAPGLSAREEFYRQAVEVAPDWFVPHAKLAEVLYRRGKTLEGVEARDVFDEAMASAERAIAINSEDPYSHYWRGRIFDRRKEWAIAKKEYELVLQLDPASFWGRWAKGKLELEEGRLEAACDEFMAACQLDGESADAWFNLGLAHLKSKSVEAAEKYASKALCCEPQHSEANNLLGVVHLYHFATAGSEEKGKEHLLLAQDYFQVATQFSPGNLEARRNLAKVLVDRGRYGQALGHVEQLLAAAPQEEDCLAEAYFLRAQLHCAHEDPALAVEALTKALRLRPGWTDALYTRAKALSLWGNDSGALADLDAVLEQAPGRLDARLDRAVIHAKLRQFEAARQELEHLLELDPEHAGAWFNLAQVEDALDHKERSEELFRGFLERYPDHPDADKARTIYASLQKDDR